VEVRGFTPEDAVDIAAWRYPGREATYDVGEIVPSGSTGSNRSAYA
jgi:hypothetical protein